MRRFPKRTLPSADDASAELTEVVRCAEAGSVCGYPSRMVIATARIHQRHAAEGMLVSIAQRGAREWLRRPQQSGCGPPHQRVTTVLESQIAYGGCPVGPGINDIRESTSLLYEPSS
jgi:hypothetical protein